MDHPVSRPRCAVNPTWQVYMLCCVCGAIERCGVLGQTQSTDTNQEVYLTRKMYTPKWGGGRSKRSKQHSLYCLVSLSDMLEIFTYCLHIGRVMYCVWCVICVLLDSTALVSTQHNSGGKPWLAQRNIHRHCCVYAFTSNKEC